MKNFQSATSCEFRISAVTGSSFGARGTLRSFNPASCGKRSPFFALTALSDQTRFPHSSLPPRERGRTWSRLPSSGRSSFPVYWQRFPSRSRIDFAQSLGRFFGNFGEVQCDNHRRHTNRASNRVDSVVLLTNRQR